MTGAIGSTGPATYLPPLPQVSEAAEQPVTSEQPSVPQANNTPLGGANVSDSTLSALVAQQDVSAEETPAPPLDLKGQDLRHMDLRGLNLRGADMSGANLSGIDLSGLDFTGANLNGADLSGATMRGSSLENVSAQGANLKGATLLDTSIDGADFSEARFDSASIGKSSVPSLINESTWDATYESDVKMDGASFDGAKLLNIFFERASAANAQFTNVTADRLGLRLSNLQGANFDRVSGASIAFTESDLSRAAITNSSAASVAFYAATLEGTRFAGSSLNNTAFVSTNLTVADLSGVVREAKRASFGDTNLAGIDFSGFDFTGANFSGAKNNWTREGFVPVSGAGGSIKGANFTGANFNLTHFDELNLGEAQSFSGATFRYTIAQRGDASPIAGLSGVEVDSGSGVSAAAFEARGWTTRTRPYSDDEARALPLLQRTRNGSDVSPSQGDAEIALPQSPPSAKAQGAAMALETLKAVNEHIRTARAGEPHEAGRDGMSLFSTSAKAAAGAESKTMAVV